MTRYAWTRSDTHGPLIFGLNRTKQHQDLLSFPGSQVSNDASRDRVVFLVASSNKIPFAEQVDTRPGSSGPVEVAIAPTNTYSTYTQT